MTTLTDCLPHILPMVSEVASVSVSDMGPVCHPTHRNMLLAPQCSAKISEYLATECAAGRVLGPFLVPMVHVNHLGAVPKSTPGKYRLIVDLSYPEGHTVNCGIDGAHCSLSYVSVEDVAATVLRLGTSSKSGYT